MTSAAETKPLALPALKVLVIAAIVGVLLHFYLQGDLTQDNLKRFAASLPAWLFVPAYLTLPLVGFPISIVLLASGMKFGTMTAIIIAVFAMGFHTFVAWHLAHGFFREPLERWLEKTRFSLPRIPEKHQIWFTSVFVTVPGLPYAVKLYSLALTDLPFTRYLWIVWLFHVLNAIPFIGLGSAAARMNVGWMIGFGLLAVVMILLTNWLKSRLSDS
ncbi:TVP38/TMEM64 family protein [Fuerstiella marisgermanici]|uniref:TVP38/TMEM64 family membrane protein n=1 Tax=Fuerstiella marisgermanici TaxID=1891926 RepID=A0A1P8WLP7_9PLAN|nr:VTT domain-containing protein [Fuerstiella marisgermanici]APZ94985.1 SNARE associated Golgi protein [Fuerstiella marisgermanici]